MLAAIFLALRHTSENQGICRVPIRTVMVRFVRSMSTQAEIAGFGYPQAVPVDQEADQPLMKVN
jgi:hypothetical protein